MIDGARKPGEPYRTAFTLPLPAGLLAAKAGEEPDPAGAIAAAKEWWRDAAVAVEDLLGTARALRREVVNAVPRVAVFPDPVAGVRRPLPAPNREQQQ